VMDWNRLSKDELVGTARLNLDSCVGLGNHEPLKLPLFNANGSPTKGLNDLATVLILRVLHVQALALSGVYVCIYIYIYIYIYI